jgi:hypothetical protein
MEPHLVGYKPMARQAHPLHGGLPLLDPLLGSPSPIVNVHDSLRLRRQVSDNATHPREELSLVPLHFHHDPPGRLPARRLVEEVMLPDAGLLGRSAHGPL